MGTIGSIVKENIGGLIFCAAFVIFLGIFAMSGLEYGGGRYFALSLLHIPFGFVAWVVGNAIRKAVHPDFIITSGFWGLVKEKIFWRVGPQLILSILVLAIASNVTEKSVKNSIGAEYTGPIMYDGGDYYGDGDFSGSIPNVGYMDITKEQFLDFYAKGLDIIEVDIEKAPTMIRRGNKNLKVTGHVVTYEMIYQLLSAKPNETVVTNSNGCFFFDFSDLTGLQSNPQFSFSLNDYDTIDTVIFGEEFTELPSRCMARSTIKNVFIPNTVAKIGNEAFWENTFLTWIAIPQSVTEIGERTFGGCRNLQTVYFSKNSNLKTIGLWAFEDCTSFTSFEVPPGVEKVLSSFDGCSELTSIIFPESIKVVYVGDLSGSYGHGKLQEVTIKATTPPEVKNNSFPATISAIYVPAESLKAYQDAWFDCEFTFNGQLKPIK